jgi:hypothetical protein
MKGLDVTPSPDPADRRRDVRIAVPAGLRLELADPKMHVRVLDISEAGALVDCNLPFAVGPAYRVTFRLGSHVTECHATTTHCRRLDNGRWLAGLKLTAERTSSPLADLIDIITSAAIKFA